MTSIDGLVSGINTTQMISQLMQLERVPQTRLKERQSDARSKQTELRGLRSDVQALRNTVADLRLTSGWNRLSGTSSDASVSVTAGSGTIAGAVSFKVNQTAAANTIYSNETVATLDTVINTSGNYGTGTLSDVIQTINADSNLGYSAMAINTGSGYRLQVVAKETGAASTVDMDQTGFTFSGFTTLSAGRDAEIEIQGDNPYTITSSSNTFTDLLPGLDVTVSTTTTNPVTVSVEQDLNAQADAIESLVGSLNDFLSRAASATAANPGGTPGILFGNSAVRRTRSEMLRAVTDEVSGTNLGSATFAGISVTREGGLEFDRQAFLDASKTNQGDVQRLFVAPTANDEPGLFDRIITTAEAATATGTGRLWSEAEAANARIERWGDQIDAFEVRLGRREAALRRQYSALEGALSGLSSQANYLAGQIAGLSS